MRISLKNEIGNILESAVYLKEDRNEWGENISIYQAEANGFRCSFAASDRYPLSEAVEDLKKKAERMFRKPSCPSLLQTRSETEAETSRPRTYKRRTLRAR